MINRGLLFLLESLIYYNIIKWFFHSEKTCVSHLLIFIINMFFLSCFIKNIFYLSCKDFSESFFTFLNQSMLLWNSAAKCSACGHFFSEEKMLNTIKLLNFNRNGSVKRGPNNSRSVLFLQSDNKYFSICVLFLQTSLNPYPWGQSHHLRLQNHQTRAENLIRNVSVDNSLFFFNVTESYKPNC